MKHLIALLIAALGIVVVSAPALADYSTWVALTPVCHGDPDTTPVSADLSVNGAAAERLNGFTTTWLKEGTSSFSLKLVIPANRNWLIKAVELQNLDTKAETTVAIPNATEATFEVTPQGVPRVEITVETCVEKVRLQIATTTSCKGLMNDPSDPSKPQGGVTVNIGGQTYTSNDNGVIEVEVLGGDYDVTASWHGAAVSYVRQNNGAVAKKQPDTGIPTVRLSDAKELLEVRLATCEASGAGIIRATVIELGDGASIDVQRRGGRGDMFVGAQLRDGDIVTVKGLAKIKWEDGHIIAFENPRGSVLFVIGPLSKAPAGSKVPTGGAGPSVFQLTNGVVRILFPRGQVPESDKKFQASSHTIAPAVKGTDFTFGYDPGTDTSTVALFEGLVTIIPVNTALPPFDLYPGQQVSVTSTEIGPVTPIGQNVPAKPLSAAPVQPVPAGTYLGCFADTADFDLDGYLERSQTNTPEACFETCQAKGFKFMGVQYGESCLCGDSYGKHGKVAEEMCNYGCTGRPDTICGGYSTNSIYTTGN